jgi:hypothetical protein
MGKSGPMGETGDATTDGPTEIPLTYHPLPYKPTQSPLPRYEDNPGVQELSNNEVRYEADSGSPRVSGR